MAHHLHCFASLITIMKEFTEELDIESEDYDFSLNITILSFSQSYRPSSFTYY